MVSVIKAVIPDQSVKVFRFGCKATKDKAVAPLSSPSSEQAEFKSDSLLD